MSGEVKYNELSSAQINDTKSIVISEYSKGGFTLAQKICAEDGNKKIPMYLKNPIQIDDINGLQNLRDALNVALEILEK